MSICFFLLQAQYMNLAPQALVSFNLFLNSINNKRRKNMKVYKEYLSKKILETVKIEIENGEEITFTTDYIINEDDFYLALSREGEELKFDFIDNTLRLVIYHYSHCSMYYEIKEMEEFTNLKYAIDMLVELFIYDEWYTFTWFLTNLTLWEMVEEYKMLKSGDI